MRKVALLGLLAAIALTFGMSAGAQEGPIGAAYQPFGGCGVLEIVNAQGKSFMAFDAFGAPLLQAHADGEFFAVECPNHGPDEYGVIVRVLIEETGVEFVIDDPDDWIWE